MQFLDAVIKNVRVQMILRTALLDIEHGTEKAVWGVAHNQGKNL